MPKKIITYKNQQIGVWKILEPNVINPNTKDKNYIGKDVFSKCICTNCNKTIRYIRNNELFKKYYNKKCASCTKHDIAKQYQPHIGDIFGYLKVIGDGGYNNERHYSLCQCKCGNIILVKDNSLKSKNTQSCGCMNSRGEANIEKILKDNNYIYNHNIIFPEFFNETHLKYRFDFIIYNENGKPIRFIEFDGRQHIYGPDTEYWGHSKDTLESIKERDNIKNKWCLQHNYPLVRIPYYKANTITLNDIFSDIYRIKE